MAVTLLPHQPIDFFYRENEPCENLSSQCLQYETTDTPMFQIRADGTSAPLAYISGTIDGVETEIGLTPFSVNGEFYTYKLDFEALGITEGCFSVCVSDISISGINLVTNGTFNTDLTGWVTADGLQIGIDNTINPSDSETCDGEVTLDATGGTPSYEWSMDGITYQVSDTFTGLCYGIQYTFYVRDSYGVVDSIQFTFQDCSNFAGSEAFDVKDIIVFEIKNCEAFDFV